MKKIYHDAVNTKAIPAVKEVWESKIKQSKKNKHISYSQLSTYDRCPKQWYLTYVKKLIPYEGSIHASFGTAFHETLQEWLQVLYHGKVKDAMAMDVDALLLAIEKKYASNKPNTIDGVKIDFEKSWVHLRKSNTEPIIRIYTEATSEAQAVALANRFVSEISSLF